MDYELKELIIRLILRLAEVTLDPQNIDVKELRHQLACMQDTADN